MSYEMRGIVMIAYGKLWCKMPSSERKVARFIVTEGAHENSQNKF